jgi:hypothetical protein
LTYQLALGQGIYTPFGNSPLIFPGTGQTPPVQLPGEMVGDVTARSEDDSSGRFWHTFFVPPGSSLPPPTVQQEGFTQPFFGTNMSPGYATGGFRDPNNVDLNMIGDSFGIGNIEDGLVDWADFIAQCSQVWVTE